MQENVFQGVEIQKNFPNGVCMHPPPPPHLSGGSRLRPSPLSPRLSPPNFNLIIFLRPWFI
jgi:hypothetical protein